MFRQYQALKREQVDSILLYRMGDFYEMFFEDAKIAAPILAVVVIGLFLIVVLGRVMRRRLARG